MTWCNYSVPDQFPSQPRAHTAQAYDLHLSPLETLSQDNNGWAGKGTEAAQRWWKAEVCAPLPEPPCGLIDTCPEPKAQGQMVQTGVVRMRRSLKRELLRRRTEQGAGESCRDRRLPCGDKGQGGTRSQCNPGHTRAWPLLMPCSIMRAVPG